MFCPNLYSFSFWIWRELKAPTNRCPGEAKKKKKKNKNKKKTPNWGHKIFTNTWVSQTINNCVLENCNDGKFPYPEGNWDSILRFTTSQGNLFKFHLKVKEETFAPLCFHWDHGEDSVWESVGKLLYHIYQNCNISLRYRSKT